MRLEPATAASWRDVVALDAGSEHVASPAYYLCLCHYGRVWQPLALHEDDGHHWIGGLSVDRVHQGRGLGRAAVLALVEHLRGLGATGVARLAL